MSDGFDMSNEVNKKKYKQLEEHYSKIKFKPKDELKIFQVDVKFPIADKNPN
jgi:hypothetical protein